jgi:hypothetical protein
MIDQVMAIPGVGEVLKAVVEPIQARLNGLATA